MAGRRQNGKAGLRRTGQKPVVKALEWTDDAILEIATDGKSLMRSSFAFDSKLHSVDDVSLVTTRSAENLHVAQHSPKKGRKSVEAVVGVEKQHSSGQESLQNELGLAEYIRREIRTWIDSTEQMKRAGAAWLPLHLFDTTESAPA